MTGLCTSTAASVVNTALHASTGHIRHDAETLHPSWSPRRFRAKGIVTNCGRASSSAASLRQWGLSVGSRKWPKTRWPTPHHVSDGGEHLAHNGLHSSSSLHGEKCCADLQRVVAKSKRLAPRVGDRLDARRDRVPPRAILAASGSNTASARGAYGLRDLASAATGRKEQRSNQHVAGRSHSAETGAHPDAHRRGRGRVRARGRH